jgi:hypothetical protein
MSTGNSLQLSALKHSCPRATGMPDFTSEMIFKIGPGNRRSLRSAANCGEANFTSARGGLEPDFRVLLSSIFHGVSLGNFHQARNLWKWAEAKVWSFVVDLRTNSLRVLTVLCLSTEMWRIPV